MPVHIVERMQKMNRAERHALDAARPGADARGDRRGGSLPLQQAQGGSAAGAGVDVLDQPVGDQEDAVLGDFVAGDGPAPDEQVEALAPQPGARAGAAGARRARAAGARLRYGLDDDEPKTLEEIGRRSA
jgi:RNA polymerase nonessential primary-like sigma factor